MKDLHRCLDDYSPAMLHAIGQAWGAEDLAEGDEVDPGSLADLMQTDEGIARATAGLSLEARDALAELLSGPAALPSHRLTMLYGALRRFGPARMEREQPWLRPESPLEELYYRGLAHRAYAQTDEYRGETMFVPEPLRSALIDSGHAERRVTTPHVAAAPPFETQSDGTALTKDVFLLLVRAREGTVPTPSQLVSVGALPNSICDLSEDQRLAGDADAQRLGLAWRLFWRLKLTEDEDGLLVPSTRAREWLRLDETARASALYRAWLEDPQWDELRLLPSLLCEDTGWQNDPVAARHSLLGVLSKLPSAEWLDLPALVSYVRRTRPDYLRADGDYDSWFIRDASSGEYLTGFESWDQIEGAVLKSVLAGPLRWLGMVDLGRSAEDASPDCFRVTALGQSLLTGTTGPAAAAPFNAGARLDGMAVVVPMRNSLYERYQLERFADWESGGETARYQITLDSVWRGINSGIEVEQIIRFLNRITGDRIPPAQERTLCTWGGRFGRAAIRRMAMLETTDKATMQQLRAKPAIAALLGASLSPTSCLVREEATEELIDRLKTMGIWPSVAL